MGPSLGQTRNASCRYFFFPGFTFTGDQSLVSLARFYGFSLKSVAKNTTLDQFLARCCSGLPHLGFHLPLGLFELVVLEVKEGHVSKVGLRLGSSPGEQQVPETAWRSDADALRARWREAVARSKGWVPAGSAS